MKSLEHEQILKKRLVEDKFKKGNKNNSFYYKEDFNLKLIDRDKSLKNQSRLVEPLDPYVVEQIACMLIDDPDHSLPAIMVYEDEYGDWIIIDGNHRYNAIITYVDCDGRDWDTLETFGSDVYVIVTDDSHVIDTLTRTVNIYNGKPPTEEELFYHAVNEMTKYPSLSLEEVAKDFHVRPARLGSFVREMRIKEVLKSNGIKHDKLESSVVRRLHALHKDEDILCRVARFIIKYGLTAKLSKDLIQEVNAQSSGVDRLNKLKEWEKSPEIERQRTHNPRRQAGGSSRQKAGVYLESDVKRLTNRINGKSIESFALDDPEGFKATVSELKRLLTALTR